MMIRSLLCLGFLMILAGPGFSQTAKPQPAKPETARPEPAFYIVLNSLTKNCTVVDKMPRTDSPDITVASDAIYRTRVEAETARKTLAHCNQ